MDNILELMIDCDWFHYKHHSQLNEQELAIERLEFLSVCEMFHIKNAVLDGSINSFKQMTEIYCIMDYDEFRDVCISEIYKMLYEHIYGYSNNVSEYAAKAIFNQLKKDLVDLNNDNTIWVHMNKLGYYCRGKLIFHAAEHLKDCGVDIEGITYNCDEIITDFYDDIEFNLETFYNG